MPINKNKAAKTITKSMDVKKSLNGVITVAGRLRHLVIEIIIGSPKFVKHFFRQPDFEKFVGYEKISIETALNKTARYEDNMIVKIA